MNEITLEFTVAIKAPEGTLHNLQDQLNTTTIHPSILGEVLPAKIKETLLAAGTSNEVEVEVHPCHLINHYQGIGGLTGELWLDTNGSDYYQNMFIKTIADDEIICSD